MTPFDRVIDAARQAMLSRIVNNAPTVTHGKDSAGNTHPGYLHVYRPSHISMAVGVALNGSMPPVRAGYMPYPQALPT